MKYCFSRITPSSQGDFEGTVHSVFDHVINVMFDTPRGDKMFSLMEESIPAVPDSICFPNETLPILAQKDKVFLKEGFIFFPDENWKMTADPNWKGTCEHYSGIPDSDRFLALTKNLPSGFSRFPPQTRERAIHAMNNEEWKNCIGLGYGLTPSFDDACVGWMAYMQTRGKPFPHLDDLSMTTDVSARYLHLAQEGYFGDPLLKLIQAIFSHKHLEEAVRQLAIVGATSGYDMMEGVRLAILKEKQGSNIL